MNLFLIPNDQAHQGLSAMLQVEMHTLGCIELIITDLIDTVRPGTSSYLLAQCTTLKVTCTTTIQVGTKTGVHQAKGEIF